MGMANFAGQLVFPAHAGMSPYSLASPIARLGFPRSRGDEPRMMERRAAFEAFSPLTRG